MNEAIIVAMLSLVGTLIGSFGGILAANKLTNYRIKKLEEKVEKHNQVVERVQRLESLEAVNEEKIVAVEDRIDHLDHYR